MAPKMKTHRQKLKSKEKVVNGVYPLIKGGGELGRFLAVLFCRSSMPKAKNGAPFYLLIFAGVGSVLAETIKAVKTKGTSLAKTALGLNILSLILTAIAFGIDIHTKDYKKVEEVRPNQKTLEFIALGVECGLKLIVDVVTYFFTSQSNVEKNIDLEAQAHQGKEVRIGNTARKAGIVPLEELNLFMKGIRVCLDVPGKDRRGLQTIIGRAGGMVVPAPKVDEGHGLDVYVYGAGGLGGKDQAKEFRKIGVPVVTTGWVAACNSQKERVATHTYLVPNFTLR
ncbi:hypothetical protein BJ508DRAFT_336003 [Ascobolus immersus RN42]|uniref:BRCT domain-containing protein n=1 Tax=Ascobolus immersus RN42 TaxID=1160509 RepID=A0A3N4HGH0_ASCIM|nr:hypothetical protein BJ508DRAFT_336003 [Ascobolus immersus RN42]